MRSSVNRFFRFLVRLAVYLLAIVGLASLLLAYEIAQLAPGPDFITQVGTDMAEICAQTRGPAECSQRLAKAYGACLNPLLARRPRAECFDSITSALTIRSHPELSRPNQSSEKITDWSERIAQDVMNFDYRDVNDRLALSHAYFTPAGWNDFNAMLTKSGIVDATQSLKLHVSLKTRGNAQVLQAMNDNGIYLWHLKMPVTIDFHTDEKITPPAPINASLHLIVVRVPSRQNPDGIAIRQWATVSEK